MAELLKELFYNPKFINELGGIACNHITHFDKEQFASLIFIPEWENMELKIRMRHVSLNFIPFLPPSFKDSCDILTSIAAEAKEIKTSFGFSYLFLQDIISIKGLDHFDESVEAMAAITSLSSAEFAVRPFLIKYEHKMLNKMLAWTNSSDYHIRRLASEGCRTRLPWAMAVPFLKKQPEFIIPILEKLKADESEYVRRSVANSLNDISKDNQALVLDLAEKWKGKNFETDKLLKHALRGMIKKGNEEALKLIGVEKRKIVEVLDIKTNKEKYNLNDELEFTFKIIAKESGKARIHYLINFPTSSGKTSHKVFFLAEKWVEKDQEINFRKKFRLQHYTTRKLCTGTHELFIETNGVKASGIKFELIC